MAQEDVDPVDPLANHETHDARRRSTSCAPSGEDSPRRRVDSGSSHRSIWSDESQPTSAARALLDISISPSGFRFRVWLLHKGGAVRLAEDDSVMPQNFIECDREQALLMPPSLQE